MNRRINLLLAVALVAICFLPTARAGRAATVTVSLDVYYGDGADGDKLAEAGTAGSWQLVARTSSGDNRGLAGLTIALRNVVDSLGASAGHTFRAPTASATVGGSPGEAGFQTTFGSKPWNLDDDGEPATANMLFAQIPVSTPGPQGLFYDVGRPDAPSIKSSSDAANGQPAINGLVQTVFWNFDDVLGDRLGDGDAANNNGAFQRGVLLAQGTFTAGLSPVIDAGSATANVFTALGTAQNPPAVGTIQGAPVITQTRSNIGQKRADANLDGDVDVAQAGGQGDAQILLANLNQGAGSRLWQNGDFNGDKDVDVFQADGQGDAQILISSLDPAPLALVAAGTAAATYNRGTGEVTFDVGAGVGVLGLSAAGLIDAGASALLGSVAPTQHDASTLAYLGVTGLPTGVSSVGAVLPPNLTAAAITFAYTPLGQDTVFAPVSVVPEPASAALVAVVVAAVGAGRKLHARQLCCAP